MNREAPITGEEAGIIEKILSDAEAQAKRAIDDARRKAEAESQKTGKQAEEIEKGILDQARAKAEKIRSREVSIARIEANRILLRGREEAIGKILDQIEGGLERIREDTDNYTESLRRLATEAVSAVGGSEIVLRFGSKDEALVNEDLINAVVKSAGEHLRSEIRVRCEFEGQDRGGGCIALSEDGRVIFDNTFVRRMQRMKPQLRSMIVGEILKQNE